MQKGNINFNINITEEQVFHIPKKNGKVRIVKKVNQDGEKSTVDGHLQLQTICKKHIIKEIYADEVIVEAQDT